LAGLFVALVITCLAWWLVAGWLVPELAWQDRARRQEAQLLGWSEAACISLAHRIVHQASERGIS